MNVNQIYQLVNDIMTDGVGANNVRVKDTRSFVSYGESVISSDTNKEQFYQKLCDRIGKVYIKYRRYVADGKNAIIKTPLEFGAILQKVQTLHLGEMESNKSWGNQVNPFYAEKDETSIVQKLFSKMGTFQTKMKVIYDVQLKTAFTSETNLSAFVDLIFNDMYNSMEFAIEGLIKDTRASLIAKVMNGSNAVQKRNLLGEYLLINTDSTLDVDTCLTDVDFLKYASREINKVTKRFKNMTRLFNLDGADRFTSPEDMIVEILNDYSSATASYLDADTYHKELVSLPKYSEIDSWQSSGTTFDFDDVSKINIKLDDDTTIEQSGILALVRDVDSCGVMFDRMRVKSIYNPISEMTNITDKLDWGSYVDTSENAVVFYIAS